MWAFQGGSPSAVPRGPLELRRKARDPIGQAHGAGGRRASPTPLQLVGGCPGKACPGGPAALPGGLCSSLIPIQAPPVPGPAISRMGTTGDAHLGRKGLNHTAGLAQGISRLLDGWRHRRRLVKLSEPRPPGQCPSPPNCCLQQRLGCSRSLVPQPYPLGERVDQAQRILLDLPEISGCFKKECDGPIRIHCQVCEV